MLGDDLALNAQQVSGIDANRELPVVWAVAKGSLLNKAILVPAALLLSAFVPWLVIPLMTIGGAFLCFEGVEKLAHKLLHSGAAELREPHRIARYLEDMATAYHKFYDSCRVLPHADEEVAGVHIARLWLCAATRQVVAHGLDLCGVTAPERM